MYSVYRTLSNDTLDSVSKMFETDIQTLERLNGFNSITTGQMIVVPQMNLSSKFDTYTIEKGDNLYNLAKKYSVNLKSLQYLNGLDADDYIYPGQTILVPKKEFQMYVVGENETLSSIANNNGVTVEQLVKDNDKIYLHPEQLLFFKKGEIF